MILQYEAKYMEGIIELWNKAAVKIGYKEMNTQRFADTFTNNPYFSPEYTYVLIQDDEVFGFACGCANDELPLGKTSGYLTCIILEERYDTSDRYKEFLDLMENAFRAAGKQQAEVLFFNPMMLSWYIKGTNHHEHNNAPGVFLDSMLHQELIKHGYIERAIECAMYLNLEQFEIPERINEKENKAVQAGYEVALFNQNKHYDLEEMLSKLDNPLWEKEIAQAAKDGIPVLVAAHNNKTVGFAGPISRQESGRGYFAGIGVNKEHEGHGLGTVLFYKLCQEEKSVGAEYMSLYTGETNPAGKIYLQAGFQTVQKFAVMRKPLTN